MKESAQTEASPLVEEFGRALVLYRESLRQPVTAYQKIAFDNLVHHFNNCIDHCLLPQVLVKVAEIRKSYERKVPEAIDKV